MTGQAPAGGERGDAETGWPAGPPSREGRVAASGDGAASAPDAAVPTRSPRQRLAKAMPLGSIWTARSSLGHLRPGPMRLIAFRCSYMEFDAGARYATRIGYPPTGALDISQDGQRVTLIENGFIAVFERQ